MFEDELNAVRAEYDNVIAHTKGKYDLVKSRKSFRAYIDQLETSRENLTKQALDFASSIDQLLEKQKLLSMDVEKELMEGNKLGSNKAIKILWKNIKEAVKKNTEFNNDFFLKGLRKACLDPRTVTIVPLARGSDIKVQINLKETAGTVNDWEKAVKKVRETFNRLVSIKNLPQDERGKELARRDWFWKEKFYLPAREGKNISRRKKNKNTGQEEKIDVTARQIRKYWNTMHARLEASGKLAPYWQIIDQGSVAMKGSGTAYPEATNTNFVANSIQEIKSLYGKLYGEKRQVIQTEIDRLRKDKKEVVDELNAVKKSIKEYQTMIVRTPVTPEVVFYARVVGKAERTGRRYSQEKFERVLMALRSRDISGLRITAEGRIELTERGYPRFRASISRIIREYEL